SQNGLRDSQATDNQQQCGVEHKKTAQLQLRINQRITEIHQRNIKKIELQAKETVEHAGRARVKHLAHDEPNHQQQRNQKRGLESRDVLAASACGPKGDVNQDDQKILGEINCHVIAKELAGKILEKKPAEKEIQAVPPVVQDLYSEG